MAVPHALLQHGAGDAVQSVAVVAEFQRDVGGLDAATDVGSSHGLAECRSFRLLAPGLRVVLAERGLLTGKLAFLHAAWMRDVLLQRGRFGELTVERRDVHVLPGGDGGGRGGRRGRSVAECLQSGRRRAALRRPV